MWIFMEDFYRSVRGMDGDMWQLSLLNDHIQTSELSQLLAGVEGGCVSVRLCALVL